MVWLYVGWSECSACRAGRVRVYRPHDNRAFPPLCKGCIARVKTRADKPAQHEPEADE